MERAFCLCFPPEEENLTHQRQLLAIQEFLSHFLNSVYTRCPSLSPLPLRHLHLIAGVFQKALKVTWNTFVLRLRGFEEVCEKNAQPVQSIFPASPTPHRGTMRKDNYRKKKQVSCSRTSNNVGALGIEVDGQELGSGTPGTRNDSACAMGCNVLPLRIVLATGDR